ncbi:uncharacterized protein BX663DRAFT_506445 [Cokeromyces recurvatus]|uniref:uncharacterized protein n=1 Tax=Cokeromyces recurvatus TaxID=90255 RepID=UPI00221FE46C|nr:uncharacterized protein BX663DRAFT_506445 [Cokeromyces recurvatus]KAI7904107.1 hypothetical protein BX663DRAFT_506445 [Cokeromyces recurvatus]
MFASLPSSPPFFFLFSRYQTSTNKAEKRAEHNAIERARRECLNTKFQQLARILPNLQHHRRPSKGQIVEKALDWVKQSTTKENRYQYQIMQLQNENKKLLKEINRVKEQSLKETIESPTLSSSLPTYSYKNTLFSSSFQQQIQVNSIKTERDDNHNTSITSANDTVSSSSYHNHQQNINLPLMYPIPSPKQNWNYLQHNTSSSNSFIYAPVEENLILNKSLQLPDMELIPHKGENKYMFSSEEF